MIFELPHLCYVRNDKCNCLWFLNRLTSATSGMTWIQLFMIFELPHLCYVRNDMDTTVYDFRTASPLLRQEWHCTRCQPSAELPTGQPTQGVMSHETQGSVGGVQEIVRACVHVCLWSMHMPAYTPQGRQVFVGVQEACGCCATYRGFMLLTDWLMLNIVWC